MATQTDPTTCPYPTPETRRCKLNGCGAGLTFQVGRKRLEEAHVASVRELAQRHLHVVQRATYHGQDDDVRDEEGAAAVLVGREREAPYVAQAHRHGHTGHQEFQTVSPLGPLCFGFAVLKMI